MRVVAALALALIARAAHADELANSPVRAGYEPTGRLLDFEARRRWDVDRGIDPMLTYVSEVFVAPQLDDRVVTAGLLMLEVDVDVAKLIGPRWGKAYASGVAIHGRSVSDELGDLHGISGNTAPPEVRLFEAWIEQPIGPVTLRAGLLAADQELLIADHGSTLIAATFGMTSQFSANIGGPAYPVGTPGASARLELGRLGARLAVYDGTQRNEHGIPRDLGPAYLVLGEVGAGPVRLGGWHHDEHGRGVYAVADAQLEPQLGAFARAGYCAGAPVRVYADAGVRISPGARRPHDLASLGIAFATTEQGAQTVVEATYELQVRWLTIQPDLQLVLMRERTVGVAGTRATIVF